MELDGDLRTLTRSVVPQDKSGALLASPLVLEDESTMRLVFVQTKPLEPLKFHNALRELIEHALLFEFSRPPIEKGAAKRIQSLHLVSLCEQDRIEDATRAFALRPTNITALDEAAARALRSVLTDFEVNMIVHERESPLSLPTSSSQIETALTKHLSLGESWGDHPGSFAKALAASVDAKHIDIDLLDLIENTLISDEEGIIRELPPLCFQALCDLFGWLANKERNEKLL